MTFTVRHRGDSSGNVRHDWLCPVHGRFEADVPRTEVPDSVPCPEPVELLFPGVHALCGLPSPWSPTAIACKVAIAGFNRGKAEAPPSPNALTTRDLAEGMPVAEWRKKRAEMRREQRRKKNKEMR